MSKAVFSTFSGGMDLDSSKNKRESNTYYEAYNLRIIDNSGLKSGALTTATGNTSKFRLLDSTYIVGSCSLGEGIVLFAKGVVGTSNEGDSFILYFEDDGTDNYQTVVVSTPPNITNKYRLIYSDGAYTNKLNFSDKVEAVGIKESDDIQKVYWVDSENESRYLNIIHDDEYNDLSIDIFDSISNTIRNNDLSIEFDSYTSGNLISGTKVYIAQLYKIYGGVGVYSSTTDTIPISKSVTGNTANIKGSPVGLSTTSGVKLNVLFTGEGIYTLRVIALDYSESTTTPSVRVIANFTIESGILTNIVDTGQSLDTLSFEEVRITSPFILKPSTIETKDNILFQGNITEEYFDVPFDARAYRFLRLTDQSYTCDIGNTPTIVTTSNWDSVDEKADCINPYNDLDNDGDITKEYCFLPNSTTQGAEGDNIKVTINISNFKKLEKVSDASIEEINSLGSTVDSDNYYYSGIKKSFQRDEIYRLGIVFFDDYNRTSPVKWICDFRTPNASSSIIPFELVGNDVIAFYLQLNVEIKASGADYSNVSGYKYQVVIAKRESTDKTVLTQGFLTQSDLNGGYYVPPGNSTIPFQLQNIPDWSTKPVLFYSPEISLQNVDTLPEDSFLSLSHIVDPTTRVHEANDINTAGIIQSATTSFRKYIGSRELDNPATSNVYNYSNNKLPIIVQEYLPMLQSDSTRSGLLYKTVSFPGSSYLYKHASNDTATDKHLMGTCIGTLLDSNNFNTFIGTDHPSPISTYYGIFNLKRNIVPYGGNTYSSRKYTTFVQSSSKEDIGTVAVCYGDTYIGYFDCLYGASTETLVTGNAGVMAFAIPLESNLNLNLLSSSGIFKGGTAYDFQARTTRWAMLEKNNIDGDYYEYNNAYSSGGDSKIFFQSQPNFKLEKSYSNRVRRSEVKINSSIQDGWTIFKEDNYIDVDSSYGDIVKLYNYNTTLLFFQPKGFGVLSVNKEQLINGAGSNAALVLGTGGVLSRFDYISSRYGASTSKAIVQTDNGFYFYDQIKGKIIKYSEGLDPISLLEGVNSYIRTTVKDSEGILYYDPLHEEMYSKFNNDDKVLCYNELLRKFVSYYEYNPTFIINNNKFLYTTGNNKDFYKHNTLNKAKWFDAVYKDVKLDLLINPNNTIVNQFSNIHFKTEVYDYDYLSSDSVTISKGDIVLFDGIGVGTSGNYYLYIKNTDLVINGSIDYTDSTMFYDSGNTVNHWKKTFDSVKFSTDYQDSNTITLVYNKNIQKMFRSWATDIAKNTITRSEFMIASDWNDYMTDTYLRVLFTFNGGLNRSITIHDITTYYDEYTIQ